MWTHDNTSRRQHRENFCYAGRDDWLGDVECGTRFSFSLSLPRPCEQHADRNADDESDNGDPDRVHDTIVGAKAEGARPLAGS